MYIASKTEHHLQGLQVSKLKRYSDSKVLFLGEVPEIQGGETRLKRRKFLSLAHFPGFNLGRGGGGGGGDGRMCVPCMQWFHAQYKCTLYTVHAV